MKSLLKRKLLAHNLETGMTLIELIVVMVIIGILAAIALPYILNQTNKAKQTEAKLWLGTLNRAQQAYILEHVRFTNKIDELGVTIKNNPNYQYRIALGDGGNLYAIQHAQSLNQSLRAYVGMSAIVQDSSGMPATQTILCESARPMQGEATAPTYASSSVNCGRDTQISQ